MTPSLALVLERYWVEKELARGGLGVVYAARDQASGKRVAVKRLLPDVVGNASVVRLFEREYHTLARLKHPRIIEVYDYGVDAQGPGYAMELLEGPELRELAPLPYAEACGHLRDVASSLALLHAGRLLHRDLSPRNVRLTAEGRAKLIDFGSLTSFGVPDEVVGTPPCIAPEALQGAALDHRADLFGLGALAYWTLTHRHAYPARELSGLLTAWNTPPLRPSEYVPSIPAALDDLVLSLLSLDALGRPASAAEVIDRLSGIAGLPPEESTAVARSYFLSSGLVGREPELDRVGSAIARAKRGEGATLVIEGRPGVGRTRLLSELLLNAQLAGVTSLLAVARDTTEPYAVVRALLSTAVQRVASAGDVLERHRSALGDLLPRALGASSPPSTSAPIREVRAAQRAALRSAFLELASAPLVLAVDDLQAADEDSVTLLGLLALETARHPLLLVVTQRSGDETTEAARALSDAGARIRLRDLPTEGTQKLVTALFGGAEHSGRLARFLHERTAGNPGECLLLAQHLVDLGVIGYADGAWALPQELTGEEVPATASGTYARRVAALSADGNQLAHALSVHRAHPSFELCLRVTDLPVERAFAALDELVREGFLASSGDSYRFVDGRLREHLLLELSPERRVELSGKIGRFLAGYADRNAVLGLEAGLHLIDAGARGEGADLLVRSGFTMLATAQTSHLAVTAVEAAVAVYEEEKRSLPELTSVYGQLAVCGYYVDRRLGYRYGKRAIELALEATGVGVRVRTTSDGSTISVGDGIGAAFMKHAALVAERAGGTGRPLPEFGEGFTALFGSAMCVGAVAACCMDPELASIAADALLPARELGSESLGAFVHEQCLRMQYMACGNGELAAGSCVASLATLDAPDLPPEFALTRDPMRAGILFSLGVTQSERDGDIALDAARQLDSMGPLDRVVADQLRLLHHAYRGESQLVAKYRAAMEVHAVEGGTTWQAEIFVAYSLACPYSVTGDLVGLRRNVEQLARLAEGTPSLLPYLELSRALHHQHRGEVDAALALYPNVLERMPPRKQAGWYFALMSYATALNLVGRHADVLEHVLPAYETASDYEKTGVQGVLSLREFAFAEAGLGFHDRAAARLDVALRAHAGSSNSLMVGLLHDARARLAILVRDGAAFDTHLEAARGKFAETENPLLIARAEQLANEGARKGVGKATLGAFRAPHSTPRSVHLSTVSSRLGQARGAKERAENALSVLVQETRASAGYLYTMGSDGPTLAASTGTDGTSTTLGEDVTAALAPYLTTERTRSLTDVTAVFESAQERTGRRSAVLSVVRGGRLLVVGVIVLEKQDGEIALPDPDLAAIVANVLYDAGDVATVHVR